MASSNKFATMLHKKTNKLTLILTYVILEWVLIILLLLNSLYSYFIIKFADYFGLKRPCIWCSRLDHIFEPENKNNLYRDLVCESHANEISRLGFCSKHQKLTEAKDMCEDCLSSSQSNGHQSCKMSFFRWGKDVDSCCSCCDASLNSKFYTPCALLVPSWDVMDEEKSMKRTGGGDYEIDRCLDFDDEKVEGVLMDQMLFDSIELSHNEENKIVDMVVETEEQHFYEDRSIEVVKDLSSVEVSIQDVDTVLRSGRSSAVEIVDSQDLNGEGDYEQKLVSGSNLEAEVVETIYSTRETVEVVSVHGTKKEAIFAFDESMAIEENEKFLIFHATGGNLVMEVDDQIALEATMGDLVMEINKEEEETTIITEETQKVTDADDEATMRGLVMEVHEPACAVFDDVEASMGDLVMEADEEVASFEAIKTVCVEEPMENLVMQDEQVGISEVTRIVSEVIDNLRETMESLVMEVHQHVDNAQATRTVLEVVDDVSASETLEEEISSNVEAQAFQPKIDINEGEMLMGTEMAHQEDLSTSSVNLTENADHGSKQDEETQECKPISIEISERTMNKDFMFYSKHSDSEEKSVPNTPTSIESLIEYGEGVSTVDKLHSALKAERKALNALYAELEEERSASAISASQTMAMITRLQEEKAAVQMEAFQYQRMMEEQSEYDQEALQLLNELMVKREREKQELEKELEICRKKNADYEAKEKHLMNKRKNSIRSGTSSGSLSNAEDSDDGFYGVQENGNHHNTPVDEVLNLDESLDHFEEERMSILEQLKALEQKLFTLDDEEEKQLYEENGNNGFSLELNEDGILDKHDQQERRIMGLKAKCLLPLFNAESEDGESNNGHENGFDSVVSLNSLCAQSESESNKHAIEEEVDHVYGRLQALEEDREFLRHCIGSLKKGDKGIDLLQEILIHLRDLRNVDLRVKNVGENLLQ